MTGLIPLLIMAAGALGSFLLMAWLIDRGRNGYALTWITFVGTVVVVFTFEASRAYLFDPLRTLGWIMVLWVPALLGGGAGALTGWWLRRRREKQ